MTTLADFVVLKRLQVGDIEVSPKQVAATYTAVNLAGEVQSTKLIYSYQQPWFDKKQDADVNLASMMLAQVALNYGLFCQELVFDGLYSKIDQRFLLDMLENTSREILTNKLLIDNEFLLPPYQGLQAGKQERYTQARVSFTNTKFAGRAAVSAPVQADQNKYAILSSGGKDSLVTYGLLKEFGEPHPIFVNESGRHWFTAVNAYRYFDREEPNTAKVWCNSDRVFNWMLKQLTFIRKDYANVRADIYPVRLWTVAVFLFGVLPIALKKGMGNIVIGDEYDTTEKKVTNGITHYGGLYDQSKYFDNALTRYYQKKSWQVYQFSMLRSMSELLIMKVLLKRYPLLQAQQISCHAAHEKEGRMYPCGKCEKCRRIIGMITALGEDPRPCGYTSAQIEQALQALPQKKVKQIGSDAAHLFYLLLEKGVIQGDDHLQKMARQHPQVVKLRFDRERSNLEDLPVYLRVPLFSVLAKYAEGSMQRIDNNWREVELTEAFLTSMKYKHDKPEA